MFNEKISFQNNSCLVDSDEPFKNLNSFDFVGTVEKFEEDCQKMCLKAKEKGLHILSMQKTHKNKSKNENFKQNVIDSLSDESQEMLLHANKYDYRLLESLKK